MGIYFGKGVLEVMYFCVLPAGRISPGLLFRSCLLSDWYTVTTKKAFSKYEKQIDWGKQNLKRRDGTVKINTWIPTWRYHPKPPRVWRSGFYKASQQHGAATTPPRFLLLRFDKIDVEKSSVTDLKGTRDFSCTGDNTQLLVYTSVHSPNLLNVYYREKITKANSFLSTEDCSTFCSWSRVRNTFYVET